jgi:hypothetical protein
MFYRSRQSRDSDHGWLCGRLREIIERAGIVEQPLARRALLVREKVSYEQGNRRISVEPADTYQIDCLIDFTHPMIGVQSLFVELSNGAFSRDIAAARTFGFTNEIEALRRANLIRGGSLDNAIVLTPEGMLNEMGCAFEMSSCVTRSSTSSAIWRCWECRSREGRRGAQRSHHACWFDVEAAAHAIRVGYC